MATTSTVLASKSGSASAKSKARPESPRGAAGGAKAGESSKVNEREVDIVDAVEIHSDHE
jgi:hypothetical protein